MKVELPYTKDSFDADAQNKFLSAVASSVDTPVGNLYIRSVVEKTSSRRAFRKLLAVSVEVDFAIRVPDAAAQAAMIANEGLTAARLNTELARQVLAKQAPRFCVRCLFGLLAALRRSGLTMFCPPQNLPAVQVLTQPAALRPPAFSAARRAGPAMSAVIIAALLRVSSARRS
jgi:hypothetical protein